MNIEQAKKKLEDIVDFYKLNDENNYDYSDDVLISMRLVLEEIERLNNIIDKKEQFLGDNIKRLEREVVKRDNIINELKIILRQKGIEIMIYDQPNYEKISGYVSITMTPEQIEKELKGEDKE